MKKRTALGPGLLVTAAFIGPGTVTTASAAGARFGHALLWALLFSVLATIVLQEMSARLGLVTRAGLGEALRTTFSHPLPRYGALILVVAAIAFGNTAFETGNIMGAAMGLNLLTGWSQNAWAAAVGIAAFVFALGAYRHIEKTLITLVAFMSIAFVTTAVIVRPDLSGIVRGAFVPSFPPESLLTIVALVGTTVVPYNLFLHASTVQEKWTAELPLDEALRQSRRDTGLSIALGGLVTVSIAIAAATIFPLGTGLKSAADMVLQLEPLLGPLAKWFFAAGLFAAGLTSAITAPLATAYATAGALGWRIDLRSARFRAVWISVIGIGTVLAVHYGKSPINAILFAQAANGVLLPVVAIFLLGVMNRRKLLGVYVNGTVTNLLGVGVVGVAAFLGIFKIIGVAAAILKRLA